MKRVNYVLRAVYGVLAAPMLLAALLVVSSEVRVLAQEKPFEDALVLKARQFLDALSLEDFQTAVKDFDETMMRVSGPEALAAFWKQVPNQLGAFKKQSTVRRDKLGDYDIILITCEFEKVTLDARVVFDQKQKIAGFQFVPSTPSVPYEPPAYADTTAFEEREVTVGSGEWKLPGTLTIPKGEGPFAALVLVHGSGPNDRDETIGPNKPFKDIAWGLATRGIAVIRYEKRTRVHGTKLVGDERLSASLTVKEEVIDDALEAVRLLARTERIDKKRIFVLGHSLGGMLIPRIAKAGEDLGIAGFIIMAGLTRPLEDTYLDQVTYLANLDGVVTGDEKKSLEETKGQVDAIKALSEKDAASSERIIFASPRYWLDLRGYYPPDVARAIKQPMLVLQGDRDYQVTVEDFENWRKALASRPDVELKLYPTLNHLFFPGEGPPRPDEYTQIHGSVTDEVISDIADFIRK